ncbi:hypothetical protein FB45DRAFT_1002596 [Roridomyces roridus]|uniref:Uncharacterized protein n=1 Tax=Roridomyces roridus TaxID=1738132 RepID=A0AAD7C049_9AGAR|nr:hypothetical protein FB45DRAFT_1002596 [Roridomyces roridus]
MRYPSLNKYSCTDGAEYQDDQYNLTRTTPIPTRTRTSTVTTAQVHGLRRRISTVFARVSSNLGGRDRRSNNTSTRKDTPLPPLRPLPSLPPELWIQILEYSTYPSSSHVCLETELPTSFLSPALSPASFGPRLAHYRATMAHKRNLTLVSREWNAYAQPVLYEFVWVARSKQAQALALTLLCGAYCLAAGKASSFASASLAALTDPDAQPPFRPPAPAHVRAGVGRFIKRLHVETPPLERCNPADLRLIVDYAPALEVYSDVRSVRRRPAAQDALFAALAAGGGLRRLTWTNYDDPALVGLGVGLGGTGAMGARLEYLELSLVSSARVAALCTPSTTASGLALPALRTLKVTLDNAAFAALSTWALPALRHLSVLSADFSYAGEGFARFFAVHGARLRQLELGHSSAHLEEHYLTGRPGGGGGAQGALSLATWCPALEEFVCSADAAWNWQHPDWIAPHTLLSAHPRVSLIGIRGIDARLRDDYAAAAVGADDNAFFFRLREQVESLLRREAFPRLKYVRDMSAGSDALRRGVVGLCHEKDSDSDAPGDARVVRFWEGVLGRCKEEGVWLEDWRGVNVTTGSLRRAHAGCA